MGEFTGSSDVVAPPIFFTAPGSGRWERSTLARSAPRDKLTPAPAPRYMKVLLHRLDGGPSVLEEAPMPSAAARRVLVETRATLVSAGTERMIVEFGRSGLLAKARQQPEKVRQVLAKARSEGIASTLEAVRSKLGEPVALGYCNAGVVVDGGSDSRFAPGTRVVTNGPHAEYVSVPRNLVARIPDNFDFDVAAFTPLAAIGLQGVRLAAVTIGERVVVYGLGLIGLLTVQLLVAHGCSVIGIDTDEERLRLAAAFGATPLNGRELDVAAAVLSMTDGTGADAVLLTLSSASNEPVHNAALMSRKRGRIVLVGVTGLQLSRDDFYAKELTFAVSCSYGPGRYDSGYEEEGNDYPIGFVRWTEQRNFDAVLQLMSRGSVDPRPLISHRFSFDASPEAYDLLTSDAPSLGIVLDYSDRGARKPVVADRTRELASGTSAPSTFSVGVVGAGNFAARVLIPALAAAGARLRSVASSRGTSAAVVGRRHGFEIATTDIDGILADEAIDTMIVATRHDSHAKLALRALAADKHVFVEKPLALTMEDLDALEQAVAASSRQLTVGFNRRFAPLTQRLREQLKSRVGPAALVLTVNAGRIPREHWVQHPIAGGGRIAGEGCHFIDLARHLVGFPIESGTVVAATGIDGQPIDDIAHLALRFSDGSTAVVHYLANGSPAYPKERIEAFADGKVWQIDNWRRMHAWGGASEGTMFSKANKGHTEELRQFAARIRSGGPPPIPYDELFEVSRWTVRLADQARRLQSR